MTSPRPGALDRLLDRLVDDELPEGDRRALLARLDAEADGWRLCALRFLEAQAFRRAIRDACYSRLSTSEPAPRTSEAETAALDASTASRCEASAVSAALAGGGSRDAAPATAAGRGSSALAVIPGGIGGFPRPLRNRTRAWQVLAMAASFALAFAAGWSVRPWLLGPAKPGSATGTPLAADQPADRPLLIQHAPPGGQQPQPKRQQAERLVQHSGASELRHWGKLRFVTHSPDGQPEVVELPVYEGASLAEHLARVQQYFPHDDVEQLRRAGFEVRKHAELIPFELEDGRQLIVPTERIEVVPVGSQSWQ
ncbi:MAG: hypothetical protein K6T86_19250 [Pirellulales bacterium]|nr:hypothetical protein [Pirellulales bacterium]